MHFYTCDPSVKYYQYSKAYAFGGNSFFFGGGGGAGLLTESQYPGIRQI
jgi:hypothetical protein